MGLPGLPNACPVQAVRCVSMTQPETPPTTHSSPGQGDSGADGSGHAADLRPSATARVSFERLRERTDELELLISGLALFALLGLPGWLWEHFETYYARMPVEVVAGVIVVLPILSGICYVLALLFLAHLGVRAHWVGLIGLKAAFPDGVRWSRIQGIGPITLARLRARLPDLDRGIERADLVASTLFSLITFTAIALGLLGAWMTLLFVLGGLFGTALGGTNWFINIALTALFASFIGAPMLRWLLDGVLARWIPGLARNRVYCALVGLIGWVERLFLPTRLIGATRLALQSHLLPRTFFACFVLLVLFIAQVSNGWFQSGRGFDLFGSQTFVSGRDLVAGHRSGYYESQRLPRDRTRPTPIIPSPMIEQAWLPLLLPYVSLMDDPVLHQRCAAREPPAEQNFDFSAADTDAAAAAREAEFDAATEWSSACLRKLWEVRIDGVVQSLDDFVVTERRDLGLRGLGGYLPLNGLSAGPHRIEIIWRIHPEQDAIVEDFVPKRVRHVIPFVWSPESAVEVAAPR